MQPTCRSMLTDSSPSLRLQTFTCFVLLDLTSAVQNRGLTTPLLANRMLVTTVGVSFVVQMALIYIPFLQGIFQTTSLGLSDLLLLLFIAGLAAGAHEARRRYEVRLRQSGRDGEEDEDEEDEEGGVGGLAAVRGLRGMGTLP